MSLQWLTSLFTSPRSLPLAHLASAALSLKQATNKPGTFFLWHFTWLCHRLESRWKCVPTLDALSPVYLLGHFQSYVFIRPQTLL